MMQRNMASPSLPRLLYRRLCTSLPTTDPSPPPSPSPSSSPSLKTMVNDLFEERNLRKLVEKFKKSSECNRFRNKHRVYEVTIRRLASAKRFAFIEEIIEDQKKYKDITKEGFAVRLISLYGKSGMLDNAFKMFDELPELKCTRTVKSFNALLSACMDSKKYDKVEELFRTNLSITPNVISYNIVIGAYCEMGSLDSAVLMLDEMEKNGLERNLVTINMLLNGFYVNGRFSDGEMIWGRMEKSNLVPDIRSFNAKLRGLVLGGRMTEAVNLVEELGSKGIKPDVCSFNSLIEGFCNAGNVEEAKKIYYELLKNEYRPNRTTLETLVPSLCGNREYELALKLCMEGLNRRCFVDAGMLQAVVDGLVKESKIEDAKKLVELGRLKNYSRSNLKMPSGVE